MSSHPVDQLPPLREVINAHGLRADKKFGQNFLLDQNITDKIARHAGDLNGVNVIEIGPGPGGLTRSLLRAGAKKVIAIEFDPRAVTALESLQEAAGEQLEIIEADALSLNLKDIAQEPRAIAANLPYNIATPLLVGWLEQIYTDGSSYQSMTLMFQKEVAERIAARPGDKAYGRLAVLAQWICHVKKAFDLPPNAFTPPPKVKSSIVHFTPRQRRDEAIDFKAMERVTALAFGQRRKMIRTSLKDYPLEELGLDPTLRAENLSLNDFIKLAHRGEI
ncbi:MAG: 16S rRNA (adenine(1518)-N(6)/adenine(1519)-N(6))-dimethyltransferase [Micavibrio sp. TMED27]|nr:16S rRNA (adenine(1518)-N(6)/adenine(1519)-N(6))-dimethyltransferase [Micavibrio sp.]OUT92584.1 MAG: 16S rRNA (adenine(1518)-N(6)/adenine(1519)-N(6))-dimethyltransferase [Micavibrio sp. TMED27]